MLLNQKLSAILTQKGISKYKLAKLTGMPYTTIYELINGKNKSPSFEAVVKIANALEIQLTELIN